MLQYLVRHGESVSNVEERVQGQADVELSALGQRAQHDGRRRQGEDEAQEDGPADRPPPRDREPRHHAEGEAHLQQPTERDLLEDGRQSRERELEPDGEQQQHHADLGQHLDGLE
jgi:hypothetical protein